MTTPTSARDASSARCSPSGANAAPFRGSTVTCWRSGAPLCSEDARSYGLLQLSDKAGGAAFTEEDADNILELAAFAGATLDALRAACGRSAAPAG
jgi:hypothetical protein